MFFGRIDSNYEGGYYNYNNADYTTNGNNNTYTPSVSEPVYTTSVSPSVTPTSEVMSSPAMPSSILTVSNKETVKKTNEVLPSIFGLFGFNKDTNTTNSQSSNDKNILDSVSDLYEKHPLPVIAGASLVIYALIK